MHLCTVIYNEGVEMNTQDPIVSIICAHAHNTCNSTCAAHNDVITDAAYLDVFEGVGFIVPPFSEACGEGDGHVLICESVLARMPPMLAHGPK